MREEGIYNIKRVDNLPRRGNANLLYVLKSESPIENFYRWHLGKFQTLPVGSTPAPPASSGITVSEWQGATDYSEGDVVVNAKGALLLRDSDGTSEATFNVTEAGNWSLLGLSDEETTWAASTYYYQGQKSIKPDVANGVVIKRIASGVSDATWLNDRDNWEKVSQREIIAYAGTATKMLGELMVNSLIIYQANTTNQTRAGFDGIEQGEWDALTS